MKKLAIIGSGDLAQLISYHSTQTKQYVVQGYYDDFKQKDSLVEGTPILGKVEDILSDYNRGLFQELMIGVGYKHMSFRKSSFQQFKGKIPFANIIHSSAQIEPSVQLGEGIFILPGSTLDHQVQIEDNVLLNTGVSIAHDSKICAHSFLSPRVAIAGFVSIGQQCNIGINSTIIDNIEICDHVQLGGASLVISSINKPGLYVGSPCHFIR